MGPRSTAPFIDAVIDQCQSLYDAKLDEDFPRIMILSLPTPFYIDRPIDHNLMSRTIKEGLLQLQKAGVDFIAMPCNSAHLYYEALSHSINVPLLNIVDETLSHLSGAGRATILGTQGTFDSKLYQAGFSKAGVDFYFNEAWQPRIDNIISLIKSGSIGTNAANEWNKLLVDLREEGVTEAVIACTDINAVLSYDETSINLVDSTKALAEATVRKYLKLNSR